MLRRALAAVHRWAHGPGGPSPPANFRGNRLASLSWHVLIHLLRSLHHWMMGPTDAVRLSMFRRWFVIALLIYLIGRSVHPFEWLTDEGFHPSEAATHLYRPPPWPLLPTWAVAPFLVAMFASFFLLLIEWHARITTWIVFGFTTYVSYADIASLSTINKLFIAGMFILAVQPPVVNIQVGAQIQRLQSVWPIRVLQATMVVMYFTSGYCKAVHGHWLDLSKFSTGTWTDFEWLGTGHVLWSQVQGIYCTDFCAWLLRVLPKDAWTMMQHSALLFELFGSLLFMAPSFWIPIGRICWACDMPNFTKWVGIKGRWYFSPRVIAMLWGFSLHLMIALTMYNLYTFSFQMVTFYLLWFSPAVLHRMNAWFARVLTYDIGTKRRKSKKKP